MKDAKKMIEQPLHLIEIILLKHQEAILEVVKEQAAELAACKATILAGATDTHEVADLRKDNERLYAELAACRKEYEELLYAVGNKWPNESRHQTALRYIRAAEASANAMACKASK